MNNVNQNLLTLKDIHKSYREPNGRILDIINVKDFSLLAGDQMVLVGASGHGKSTFLNLIAGILLPDKGEIIIRNTNLTKLTETARDRFRAENIGYVFQSFNLLQGFTALENVLLGKVFAKGKCSSTDRKQAESLLKAVGLDERLHHLPRSLSIGEQQRVAIARALVNSPPIVLADEPTGSLDSQNSQSILELLQKMCQDRGHTLLVVTHDPDVVSAFEKVVHMESLK